MPLNDYAVPDDFFIAAETGHNKLIFPCCACIHKDKQHDAYPCRYCGHNSDPVEHYYCPLCEEVQEGSPQMENIIAKGTKAMINGVCSSCYAAIKEDMTNNI